MMRYCSAQLYAERAAHALGGKWSIQPIMSVWNQMNVPVSSSLVDLEHRVQALTV